MIRSLKTEDLQQVMKIWLETNLKAHNFVDENFWKDNFDMVKEILPKAEVYVFEEDEIIKGFIGLDNGFIAGLFVYEKYQSQGIGKKLIKKAKDVFENLSLMVYEKNIKAVKFYEREGFIIKEKKLDTNTNETEYFMTWDK